MAISGEGTFDARQDRLTGKRAWSDIAAVLFVALALKAAFRDHDYFAVPAYALAGMLTYWRTWQDPAVAVTPMATRVVLVLVALFGGIALNVTARARVAGEPVQEERVVAEVEDEKAVPNPAPKASASNRLPTMFGCITYEQLAAAGHALSTRNKDLFASLFESHVCMDVSGMEFTVIEVGMIASRVQVYGGGGYVSLYVYSALIPTDPD